ncbi:PadR family transcriptional regulator [Epidermidibacterium keratini]|uniref:PadR family transcriptional regulator n=1 Tax=Epidermidibacterium keratini TaxID=1891644 RepID=A0A7L4YNK5_9ACTN|nr:PadR family transcriptional regulator [Epidermidibacterium keratini]QHC00127.1 PadR family transcriptional regulator [Epidermidibacterium keratini]
MPEMKWPSDWLRGVLPLAVLAVLREGPTYGYAISTALERAGVGAVKGGTLYPLLARLEKDGLVVSRWEAGDGGPGRKYFELTEAGTAQFAERREQWSRFGSVVAHLVGNREGKTR